MCSILGAATWEPVWRNYDSCGILTELYPALMETNKTNDRAIVPKLAGLLKLCTVDYGGINLNELACERAPRRPCTNKQRLDMQP